MHGGCGPWSLWWKTVSQDLLERVMQSPRLPSLPAIALEVLALAQTPDVDIQQIARAIQNDPALSTKILKTVNSAFYGHTREVSTISHALVVLGLNAVKTLALGFSLVRGLKSSGGQGFDHIGYWRRCLYTATAAKALSTHAGVVQQEEAFLGGLLQDVGMVAMSQSLGEEYAALLEKAGPHHAALSAHETEALGMDHADVGAALAKAWKLPPLLVEPIRYHENPDRAEGEMLPLVRCVALGNRVADIFLSEDGDGEALRLYYEQSEAWFGLGRDQAEPLLGEFHQQAEEMGSLFDLPTGNLGDPDEILARASDALTQITIQSQMQTSQLAQQNERLVNQAQTDSLTKALNRRAMDQFMEEHFQAATPKQPLSVLFMDVDHFKKFNDTHGHAVGDKVLIVFAETLRTTVGDQGKVFRYGGEEFALACPGVDGPTAAQLAENARCAVEGNARVTGDTGQELRITCSIGVATHTGDTFARPNLLVKAADQGVYAAKAAGRNCVRVWSATGAAEKIPA